MTSFARLVRVLLLSGTPLLAGPRVPWGARVRRPPRGVVGGSGEREATSLARRRCSSPASSYAPASGFAGRHRTAAGLGQRVLRRPRRPEKIAQGCPAFVLGTTGVAALRRGAALLASSSARARSRALRGGWVSPGSRRSGSPQAILERRCGEPGVWMGHGHGGLVLPCLGSIWRPLLKKLSGRNRWPQPR